MLRAGLTCRHQGMRDCKPPQWCRGRRPPISNKLLGTGIVNFLFPLPFKAKVAPSRAWVLNNGTFLCGALANPEPPDSARHGSPGDPMFGLLAILKVTSGGSQAPSKELITGSIPRAAAVRKSPPNDPMVAFLGPASTQLTTQPMQNMVVDRRAVPLPRPRPKRL